MGTEDKVLNHPIYSPSVGPEETPWSDDTIEFWLKSNWNSEPRIEGPRDFGELHFDGEREGDLNGEVLEKIETTVGAAQ